MEELNGNDVIRHMESQKNAALNELISAFRSNEGLLTTSVLEATNLLGYSMVSLPPDGPMMFLNSSWQAVKHHLNVLDAFLSKDLNVVTPWTEKIFLEIMTPDGIMWNYLYNLWRIGYLEDKITIQRTFPVGKVFYENGLYYDNEDPDFVSAVTGMDFSIDRNWNIWHQKNIKPRSQELEKYWDISFQEFYGFNLGELDLISAFFADQIKAHRQDLESKKLQIPQGTSEIQLILSLIQASLKIPQTTILWHESDLLKELSGLFGNGEKAQAWIDRLVYHPSTREFFTSPLIRVIKPNEGVMYAPLFWLFQPAPVLMEMWFGKLLKEHRKSESVKRQSQIYGKLFEDYVRNQFIIAGIPDGKIFSNKVISSSEYADVENFLVRLNKRQQFEIDHIVDLGDVVLAVSCKASDFGFDYVFARNGFFISYDKLRDVINQDLEYALEIEIEAECLNSIKTIKNSLGIESKSVRPVLITSRHSPIELTKVKEYLKSIKSIPGTAVISVGDISKILSFLKLHPNGPF
jgi:hypothetical protein